MAAEHRPDRRSRGRPAKSLPGWVRLPLGLILIVHGLVHLMGVALLLRIAEPGELTYAAAWPAAGSAPGVLFAVLWGVAAALFVIAGVRMVRDRPWRALVIAAALFSVIAIVPMAPAAPVGLVVSVLALAFALWTGLGRRRSRKAPPAYLPEQAQEVWRVLADGGTDGADAALRTADLPAPVAGWLDRVAPHSAGRPRGVRLRMHGSIRLGQWRPFVAEQVITERGFVWAAEAGRGAVRVKGCDLYADETGAMDWRLLGVVPVMRRSGADVTRSAAGRFAGELLVLSPFHARSPMVDWTAASDGVAVAIVTVDGEQHEVTTRFDDGRLVELSLPRWGDPDGSGFREQTFRVVFEGERRFGRLVLPASFTAGWSGTGAWEDGVFFRCTVDDAEPF